jgi:hypothetical protein
MAFSALSCPKTPLKACNSAEVLKASWPGSIRVETWSGVSELGLLPALGMKNPYLINIA